MKRRHRLPFGAEIVPGGVRFCLWAPDSGEVDLCLTSGLGERVKRMQRSADGWHELMCDEAHAGSRYRFRIDGGRPVPDPASRFQPDDVHGPSEVIDPWAFEWSDGEWRGRPWEEAILYELHVGTFTRAGTFAGVEERLDYLAGLGVTAIELMPVADFPGDRGWGYDGVLPFAPDSRYGRPDDLKRLVQAAHTRNLMIFLDVVYNHFGPDGSYFHLYAKKFFTDRHHTPWGKAINFDGPGSRQVRDFFIHNALYWLKEYHFDGLRLDAVHAILDDSEPSFLAELARAVRGEVGQDRFVHLILENDDNAAHLLAPEGFTAQWNDDVHHALHVLATGESRGYYTDYADAPLERLGRALTQGFAYQGEPSRHRGGRMRGEPSGHLPPTAFLTFLQNHDQIGNRAMGERITRIASDEAVRAVTAILLLAPSPPLLFMGQEWAAVQPFPYFCDFDEPLAGQVRRGRRREFASFPEFQEDEAQARIPDPTAARTYEQAILNWADIAASPHRDWLDFTHELLVLRLRDVVPRLRGARAGRFRLTGGAGLFAAWPMGDGSQLSVYANLGAEGAPALAASPGRPIYATHSVRGGMPGWSVAWYLGEPTA